MSSGIIDIFGKLVARTKSGKIVDFDQVDGVSVVSDDEARMIVPLDDSTISAIVDRSYEPEDTSMFTGHPDYIPMTDEQVEDLVDLTMDTFLSCKNNQ